MAAKTSPVLSLDTPSSYSVRIDGLLHPLLAPDALPAFAYSRLASLWPRVTALFTKAPSPEFTESEASELDGALDEFCRLVLHAPDNVHAQLTFVARMMVFQAFQQLPTTAVAQLTATGSGSSSGRVKASGRARG